MLLILMKKKITIKVQAEYREFCLRRLCLPRPLHASAAKENVTKPLLECRILFLCAPCTSARKEQELSFKAKVRRLKLLEEACHCVFSQVHTCHDSSFLLQVRKRSSMFFHKQLGNRARIPAIFLRHLAALGNHGVDLILCGPVSLLRVLHHCRGSRQQTI